MALIFENDGSKQLNRHFTHRAGVLGANDGIVATAHLIVGVAGLVDARGAHARDELGISDTLSARPVQAAFAAAGNDPTSPP